MLYTLEKGIYFDKQSLECYWVLVEMEDMIIVYQVMMAIIYNTSELPIRSFVLSPPTSQNVVWLSTILYYIST